MSEILVAAGKVGFLALLWLFILLVANVVRTDLFGRQVVAREVAPAGPPGSGQPKAVKAGRAEKPAKEPKPAKRGRKEPASILLESGERAGTRLALVDLVRIGRGADCELNLEDDDYVSTRHAELTRSPDGTWTLSDLGSTNGTWVNGVRVTTPVVVKPGDGLRIGRTQMKLEN